MSTSPPEHHAERIRRNLDLTMANIVRTNEHLAAAADARLRFRLREKNERRLVAMETMQRSLDTLRARAQPPPS